MNDKIQNLWQQADDSLTQLRDRLWGMGGVDNYSAISDLEMVVEMFRRCRRRHDDNQP